VLPRLRLRFVLATGVSTAEITLDHLALEDTKRVRPDTIGPSGPVEAHFAFRGHCREHNSRRQIVCEETDLLEEIIPRMYEVMHEVAKVSYDYVTHGRSST
jgi:hypothetical protein